MTEEPYKTYIAVSNGKQFIGNVYELMRFFNVKNRHQIYNACNKNMPLKHEGEKYYIDVLL